MPSVMTLMQAAVQPMKDDGGKPSPSPAQSIAFSPAELEQLTASLVAGSNASGSSSVPTASTRERNAYALGLPSVNNPLVYFGETPVRPVFFSGVPAATGEGHGATYATEGGAKQFTLEQAGNQVFTWDSEKVKEMTAKFKAAGFDITGFDSLQAAWQSVVSRAAGMYSVSNGKNKVTPDDVLAMSTAENTAAVGGAGGSPTTVTTRSKSVGSITNGDGWSVLRKTLSDMLGRDPSEQETRDFVGRMNHLAASHPTITTATRSGIGSGHESVTEHTKAGFNANDILQHAYQDAQANQDYAETQAGTTYYNATLSALGAIGG